MGNIMLHVLFYQNKSCHHFFQKFRRIGIDLSKKDYENLENRAVLK